MLRVYKNYTPLNEDLKLISSMLPFKQNSLFLAPMEGVTDALYRQLILEEFNDWDIAACDFLRIPSGGTYPEKHLLKHFGQQHYQNDERKKKTIYQIMSALSSKTAETVEQLSRLDFKWVDLNLGCPSKTVCKRKAGSSLLEHPEEMRPMLRTIRKNYPHFFSVKMRIGFDDDKNFEYCLKLFEDEGVDAITIHGRTRAQLYKGVANWDYIRTAVKTVKVPIIGNGDIWNVEDIDRIFDYTGCHSAMMARGALKTPWLAYLYKNKLKDSLEMRAEMIPLYFSKYENILTPYTTSQFRLRRYKGLSRYLFDDFPKALNIRSRLLRSQSLEQFQEILSEPLL